MPPTKGWDKCHIAPCGYDCPVMVPHGGIKEPRWKCRTHDDGRPSSLKGQQGRTGACVSCKPAEEVRSRRVHYESVRIDSEVYVVNLVERMGIPRVDENGLVAEHLQRLHTEELRSRFGHYYLKRNPWISGPDPGRPRRRVHRR